MELFQSVKNNISLVVIVGITKDGVVDIQDNLNELELLVETSGGKVLEKFYQNLKIANPKTFIGKGKVEEIKEYISNNNVNLVVFDDELSPSQQKNIQKIFNIRVIDRTLLILDIFAQRAKTSYAKTQIELAQYQYMLPRLTNLWTHLERQKGGIGLRGPGEREIETDRRLVRNRISLLKSKIKSIDKQMQVQRKNRYSLVRVALVGYTNSGKSTIMNIVSKSSVLAEDKLFATLDTTVRKVSLKKNAFLLSDTVGFIKKLPTQLIESFKSTLSEATEANILIHIVDISNQRVEEQVQTVEDILQSIGCKSADKLIILNKMDAYQKNQGYSLSQWEEIFSVRFSATCISISAKEKINIKKFINVLNEKVVKQKMKMYPYLKY